MIRSSRIIGLLLLVFGMVSSLFAQGEKKPFFSIRDSVHDFGFIPEERGPVSYIFTVTNAGEEPLVIVNVSPDCGCTTADWPKDAIKPGGSAQIKTVFNPAGRPGPFVKRVRIYSNAANSPNIVTLKGNVASLGGFTDKFAFSVGNLRVSNSKLEFPITMNNRRVGMRVLFENASQEDTLDVKISNIPAFIDIDKKGFKLKPGEVQDVLIFSAGNGLLPDFYVEKLELDVKDKKGSEDKGFITLQLPLVDNFATLKRSEIGKMYIETYYDVGKFKDLKPVTLKIPIHNKSLDGKLYLRSVTTSNPAIKLVKVPKAIAVGKTKELIVRINPKQIEENGWYNISSNIVIICTDEEGPVRKIKIDASF